MRTIIGHHHCNWAIKVYGEVKDIVDSGGLAYETKSAIWTYEPCKSRVMLFVKDPTNMTNSVIDYTWTSKHYELHRDRIIRLTGAKPAAYTMNTGKSRDYVGDAERILGGSLRPSWMTA